MGVVHRLVTEQKGVGPLQTLGFGHFLLPWVSFLNTGRPSGDFPPRRPVCKDTQGRASAPQSTPKERHERSRRHPRRAGLPRGIWALGFVSMLMDISSEMIHALPPAYLVLLGASTLAVGLIEGHRRGDGGHRQGVLGRAVRLARPAQAAGGHRLRTGGVHQAGVSAGDDAGLGGRRAFHRPRRQGVSAGPARRPDRRPGAAGPAGAAFGLRQSLDTAGAFHRPAAGDRADGAVGNDFRLVFWVAVLPAFGAFALIALAVRDPQPAAGAAARAAPRCPAAELARLPPAYWWVGASRRCSLARFSEGPFSVLRAQALGLGLMLGAGGAGADERGVFPVVLPGRSARRPAAPRGAAGRRHRGAGGRPIWSSPCSMAWPASPSASRCGGLHGDDQGLLAGAGGRRGAGRTAGHRPSACSTWWAAWRCWWRASGRRRCGTFRPRATFLAGAGLAGLALGPAVARAEGGCDELPGPCPAGRPQARPTGSAA